MKRSGKGQGKSKGKKEERRGKRERKIKERGRCIYGWIMHIHIICIMGTCIE